MQTLHLDVETITPLFIAGADQSHIEGEGLRSPTLRGLMRWWFRSIIGGMADEETLKEKESEIFGSPEARSKVRVLTNTIDGKPVRIDGINALKELGYFWFSIRMQSRDQRPFCYPPGSKFSITLMSDDSDALRIAASTLWATIYLGGVGARMRRGAGALRVLKAEDGSYCNFSFRGSNIVPDAKVFLEKNLKAILENFKKKYEILRKPNGEPPFCILSKKTAEIVLIDKPFVRYEDGLREISDVYQHYRSGRDRFGRKIARGILREERAVFGLPIQRLHEREKLRHASPLFVGVMKLDGTYVIRLVKFYTSVHPYFVGKSRFVRQHLDSLDDQLNSRFPEIQIEIPEVS